MNECQQKIFFVHPQSTIFGQSSEPLYDLGTNAHFLVYGMGEFSKLPCLRGAFFLIAHLEYSSW